MLLFRPGASRADWTRQAIELAERHGWGEEPLAGMAYAQVGIMSLYQGRLEEAEPWLERAERTLRAEVEPAAGMSLRYARALLELARGRDADALAAFGGAEQLAEVLIRPHTFVTSMRSAHRGSGAAAGYRRSAGGGRCARAGPGRFGLRGPPDPDGVGAAAGGASP